MSLILRYMRLPDIPEVTVIDRMAFDTPWSPRSYQYEITESNYSHMVVLEKTPDSAKPTPKWRRLITGFAAPPESGTLIVGYGGLWNIVDEAHISTIATHPQFRGCGWGEVLLAGMIRRALALGAEYIVLEVRVGNNVAQNLYKKYGFEIAGTKPNYYHNNGEDAYDMRLYFGDSAAYRAAFEPRYEALKARHRFTDEYSDARPRVK